MNSRILVSFFSIYFSINVKQSTEFKFLLNFLFHKRRNTTQNEEKLFTRTQALNTKFYHRKIMNSSQKLKILSIKLIGVCILVLGFFAFASEDYLSSQAKRTKFNPKKYN